MSDRLIRHNVYDRLRADILSCALQPGQEFREGDLADRFGVSKSPIRDALQRLELEGLIEIEPRRGHRVAPISVADARDILAMREILEVGAARAIVVSASESDLQAFDRFREAPTHEMKAFADYNRDFHLSLCDAAGNRRLANSAEQLMENYDRLCIVSLSASSASEAANMADALADHVAIIDALQARNAAHAARAITRHIQTSRRRVMRGLESRPIIA